MFKHFTPIALLLVAVLSPLLAHNSGVSLTWNREISRVFYARCIECHRDEGTAFSLTTYRDVQPRLTEIKNAVLSRRMPPWGAVKGFGDFLNDQSLTLEEIELISDWIDADAPRGNNAGMLPPLPKFSKPSAFKKPKDALQLSGDMTLARPLILNGIFPEKIPVGTTAHIVVAFPDGQIEPLLWLYEYNDAFKHPFLLRTPVELPAGAAIHGIPSDAQIALLPGKRSDLKTSR